MKNILVKLSLYFLFLFSFSSVAQDSIKVKMKKTKEFYLSPISISPFNFSVKYKRQLFKKCFAKLGLFDLNGQNRSGVRSYIINGQYFIQDYREFELRFSIELGIEFRKNKNEKLTFFHGPNYSSRHTYNRWYYENPNIPVKQQKSSRLDYDMLYVSYTIGYLYALSSHFLIAAEINPGLFFNSNTGWYNYYGRGYFNNFNFQLNTKSGMLSLVYRP